MKPTTVSNGRDASRSGSALLVVLGFLSFMVVSAVAFSIYMRAERLPSSALRRNVATRHLVKAALAHAMSRVDDAIRADPFPGLPNTNNNSTADFYHDGNNNPMDIWYGRVFMPPDPEGTTEPNQDVVDLISATRFAPITETVSVLNLEGLGYLPPPLVNDVRFLSRSTWTAKWQNFPFDAGRFAFCAVNVSDYFDINRTTAGIRTSAPEGRISLLGPVSNNEGDSMENVGDGVSASLSALVGPYAVRPTYSNADGNGGSAKATTEYVSMLDYNLALGSQYSGGLGTIRSPFYWWIDGSGSKRYFYNDGVSRNSAGVMQAARQPFINDSFATNQTYAIDFAKLEGQPFHNIDMSGSGASVSTVARGTTSEFLRQMYNTGLMGMPDVFTLYDYLDHDDIPLSLAMPGVECVPMVTAVEAGAIPCQIKAVAGSPATRIDPGFQVTETPYVLDPSSFNSAGAGLRVLVSFPFRHFAGRNINDFKVQAIMKVFVAAGAVSVRPNGDLANLAPQNATDWNQPSASFQLAGASDALGWTLVSDKVNISIPDEISVQDDAIMQVDVVRWTGNAEVPGGQAMATDITRIPGNVSPVTGVFTPTGPAVPSHMINLRPFNNGSFLPAGEQAGALATSPYAADQFKTYAAVWIRITNSSGSETYDLAPAILADDVLNSRSSSDPVAQSVFGGLCGADRGMLLFGNNNNIFTYGTLVSSATGTAPDWQPKALATVDPRFNYAPEDWFEWNRSGISGSSWLDEVISAGYFNVSDARDPDIFMFTSNQGFLQGLGEFAFLPRLSQLNSPPSGLCSSLVATAPAAGSAHAANPQSILNKACAWRTYPIDRQFYADCASVGIGRSWDDDQTVNPYTDDEYVRMAAFANTPCDYWVTGRTTAGLSDLKGDFSTIFNKMGDKNKTSGDEIKKLSDALKNAFCEKNEDSQSRIKPKKIRAVANSICSSLRSGAGSWEDGYDNLPWFDGLDPANDSSFKNFMGVDVEVPLYSIDRKFMYSYWRDCFANRQQLFLIFVRAESTALGGPGEGTPAQQGGRAVALVWREPVSNTINGGQDGANDDRQMTYRADRRPHRMRVLFYHQFD